MAGEFSTGLRAGSDVMRAGLGALNERRQTQQSERQGKLAQINKVMTDGLNVARQVAEQARIKGNFEAAIPAIDTIKGRLIETAQLAQNAGHAIDPALIDQAFESLKTMPTLEQEAQAGAVQTRAQEQAKVEGQAAGQAPLEVRANEAEQLAAAQARGQAAAPQSPVAKLGSDLAVAEEQYGKDSIQAKAIRETLEGANKGEPAKLSDVAGLRKEFTAASGDFVQVRDAFGKVKKAAENPSAAGDLSLIFNFMKMLDPGSVVREGEFANAQNAAGVGSRIRNIYNQIMSGQRLNPEQRREFVGTAGDVMGSQLQFQEQLEKQIGGIAERQGMPVSDVVVDFVGEFRDPEMLKIEMPEEEDMSGLSDDELLKALNGN